MRTAPVVNVLIIKILHIRYIYKTIAQLIISIQQMLNSG